MDPYTRPRGSALQPASRRDAVAQSAYGKTWNRWYRPEPQSFLSNAHTRASSP